MIPIAHVIRGSNCINLRAAYGVGVACHYWYVNCYHVVSARGTIYTLSRYLSYRKYWLPYRCLYYPVAYCPHYVYKIQGRKLYLYGRSSGGRNSYECALGRCDSRGCFGIYLNYGLNIVKLRIIIWNE